jgi:hypothetical protein
MDSTTIRESGRNAQGVRFLHLKPGDKVAAAVVLAPESAPPPTEERCFSEEFVLKGRGFCCPAKLINSVGTMFLRLPGYI